MTSPGWWRRFRRLPRAVQIVSWLAAGVVVLTAVAAAAGGTQPARHTGEPARHAGEPARPAGEAPGSDSATTRTPASQPSPTTGRGAPTSAPAAPTSAAPASSTSVAVAGAAARPGGGCRRGDPLADVYHPYRLQVRNACLTVTGTVAFVRHEDDGDVHFNLSLPAAEAHLLDPANRSHEDGELVAEIVPADQPGCSPGQPPPLPPTAYRSPSYDYGRCTGADISTPAVGTRVSVTGPYVLDSDHGWMEIHPVWAVTVLSAAPTPTVPVTSSPPAADTEPSQPAQPAQPAQTSQPAAPGASAWCRASAAPSNDGYPGDYQVYVQSDQPHARVTASDPGDTWSGSTGTDGSADIRLYHTSPGMAIKVTVGAASCSTTA